MRRRIAIYGATDEALRLVPLLLANPKLEIAGVHDPDPAGLRERLVRLPSEITEALRGQVTTAAEEIADAAVFLASEEARYISGALIPVDGAIHSTLSAASSICAVRWTMRSRRPK